MEQALLKTKVTLITFFKKYWIGAVIIAAFTLIFFGPIVTRISSYSEGGDAMFNAWTLARDQKCILRQGCPSYVNGNIFFPHKNSMLYSETQLSAGLLTMPLRFINENPIFSYNVFAILSFFLMGFFMYMLAMYLSKKNQFISILAGILFAYSPFRMAALSHLQNSSIFYLPLAILLIFKYFDTKKRGYLIGLFITLVLQFYGSWYQMVYALIAVGLLLAGYLIFKLAKPKVILSVFIVVCLAALSTAPLAKSYAEFSKTSNASFDIQSQATYSASLLDYFIPEQGTLLGKLYYQLRPQAHRNSYNPDSRSYYGMTMYFLAITLIVLAYKKRKRNFQAMREYRTIIIFAAIAIVGAIISFGPLLKFRESAVYGPAGGLQYAIVMPYALIIKLLPQLSFMRALGRSGVLILFSLCCFLALVPIAIKKIGLYQRHRRWLNPLIIGLIIFELIPFHRMPMRAEAIYYNQSIPEVYKYIKNNKDVDNILVMTADFDYAESGGIPTWLPEVTMWSGYHNKNVYNGYSGYLPPDYYPMYWDFHEFRPDDIPKLKKLGLRYVLIDTKLQKTDPGFAENASNVLGKENKVYKDKRYVLYKIPK